MSDYSNYDSDVFSCTYEGHTAVICLKSESFKMAMDASKMHEMLECLNAIEVDSSIKGILTLHTAEYERLDVLQDFKVNPERNGVCTKRNGGNPLW